ncbi:MAG: methionyl-tRNA formyltransferase [Aureliella sp.]
MRIIVMGTGPFAVPASQKLLDLGHDIPLVVTRPLTDPPPKKLPPRPVFDWAEENGIELFQPLSINTDEAIERLKELGADLFFVCDYGQILSSAALSAARLGGINLHGSILPRHRGAAPVQWALLRGDVSAGVTVIHMTPKLDAGPALAVASTLVKPDETAEELEPRLAELGVASTVDAVDALAGWDGASPIGTIQDRTLVTKAPRFAKADGLLDPRLPAEYLVRLVRACQPWPGTFTHLTWPSGKRLRVIVRAARATEECLELSAAPVGATSILNDADAEDGWKNTLAVRCASGVLLVGLIQPAGKRVMSADEFSRGHASSGVPAMECPDQDVVRLDERFPE